MCCIAFAIFVCAVLTLYSPIGKETLSGMKRDIVRYEKRHSPVWKETFSCMKRDIPRYERRRCPIWKETFPDMKRDVVRYKKRRCPIWKETFPDMKRDIPTYEKRYSKYTARYCVFPNLKKNIPNTAQDSFFTLSLFLVFLVFDLYHPRPLRPQFFFNM